MAHFETERKDTKRVADVPGEEAIRTAILERSSELDLEEGTKKPSEAEPRSMRRPRLILEATDLYLAALLATKADNFDLSHLLTADEKRSFDLALRVLMRGSENLASDIDGLTDPKLFSDVSHLLDERGRCIADARRLYFEGRKQAAVLNGTSILKKVADDLRAALTNRVDVCQQTYQANFTNLIKGQNVDDLAPEDAENDVRYRAKSLFIDVIARYIYEDKFLPIKVSACESDPKSGFCEIGSLRVRDVVMSYVDPSQDYVEARASSIFGLETTSDQAVPADNLKEIDRLPLPPVRPDPFANCGTGANFLCP